MASLAVLTSLVLYWQLKIMVVSKGIQVRYLAIHPIFVVSKRNKDTFLVHQMNSTSANVVGTEFYIVQLDVLACSGLVVGAHIYDRLACWLGGKGIVYHGNHACSGASRP